MYVLWLKKINKITIEGIFLMKLIHKWLLITAFTAQSACFSQEAIISTELINLSLSAEPKEITPSAPVEYVNGWFGKYKKQTTDLSVKVPTIYEQKKTTFELFEKAAPTQETLFDADSLDKLHIINGTSSNPKHSLAGIMPTITVFGEVAVQQTLAAPKTEYNDIVKTQNGVRYFAEHPEVAQKAANAFTKIQEGQALFLSFFDTRLGLEHDVTKHLYYGKWLGSLNKSSLGLVAKRFSSNILNTFLYFIPMRTYLYGMLKLPVISAENKLKDSFNERTIGWIQQFPQEVFEANKQTEVLQHDPRNYTIEDKPFDPEKIVFSNIPTSSPNKSKEENLALTKQAQLKIAAQLTRQAIDKVITTLNMWSAGKYIEKYQKEKKYSLPKAILRTYWMTAIEDAIYAWRVSKGISTIKLDDAIMQNFQLRLIGVAKVVEGMRELAQLLEEHPTLAQAEPQLNELTKLFVQKGHDICSLIELLQTNTFKGETSFFSNSGNILATNTLMNEQKEKLVPALHAAGKLEGMWAAARMVTENKPERGIYTFATIVESNKPILHIKGARNPLMRNAQNAIENNISIGLPGSTDTNLLITGPNGSGKSVFMQIPPLAVAQIQAYGIASANEISASPFAHVITSVNVQEDLQADLSTFMAQQKRFNDVVTKALDSNNRGKKALVMMDEALSGTSDIVGGPMVFDGGKQLAELENTITIMASHFTQPSELEEATNGAFSSYYLDVEVANGEIKRLFTLKRGKNPWWKIDQTMTEAYVRALAQESN